MRACVCMCVCVCVCVCELECVQCKCVGGGVNKSMLFFYTRLYNSLKKKIKF